jgi:uncharacterized protein (DUF302 family)
VYKIDPLAVNFLPCKFVIRESNHHVTIEMIRPSEMIALMSNDALVNFARVIEDKLIHVCSKIN